MSYEVIARVLEELERLPIEEPPRSQIETGSPADYLFITANRSGLLSWSRAFLRAALQAPAEHKVDRSPERLDFDHDQVIADKRGFALGFIEHASVVPLSPEVLTRRRRAAWRNDRYLLVGCALIGFFVMFLIVSGVMLWFGLIFGREWVP